MEQKFKMQIQRLAKHAAAVLTAVTVGILSAVAVFSQNSNPVYGAENGIYLAGANPSYRNPSTGAIEDSGGEGSAVLGQSMTESATYGRALIEVDPAGNTYATIRMQLMDNIENPQFQVDGSPVSATLMQEDYSSNTADYRFRINSENSVVRVNMYVTAMGRDIIYYITFSGLSEGAGDFITSVTVEEKGGSAGPDRLHQQKQMPYRQRLQKTHRRKMPEFRNMMRQENRSMQKRRRAKKTAAPAFLSEWVL